MPLASCPWWTWSRETGATWRARGGLLLGGAFSPDGATVAVSVLYGGVQLFDVDTGDAVGIPVVPPASGSFNPSEVHWAEDGRSVWFAEGGSLVRLDADPAGWPELACSIVHRELTPEEWTRFVDPDSDPVPLC